MTRSISYTPRSDDEEDRYLPSFIAILVLMVGAIGMLYALLTFVTAVYIFISGFISIAQVLSRTQASFVGLVPFGIIAGATLITVGVASLQYYIAKNVIQGARWAWWVTLIFTAPTIPMALGVFLRLPEELTERLPWWWSWVALVPSIFTTVVLILAIFADAIVRASISRHQRRSASPG